MRRALVPGLVLAALLAAGCKCAEGELALRRPYDVPEATADDVRVVVAEVVHLPQTAQPPSTLGQLSRVCLRSTGASAGHPPGRTISVDLDLHARPMEQLYRAGDIVELRFLDDGTLLEDALVSPVAVRPVRVSPPWEQRQTVRSDASHEAAHREHEQRKIREAVDRGAPWPDPDELRGPGEWIDAVVAGLVAETREGREVLVIRFADTDDGSDRGVEFVEPIDANRAKAQRSDLRCRYRAGDEWRLYLTEDGRVISLYRP